MSFLFSKLPLFLMSIKDIRFLNITLEHSFVMYWMNFMKLKNQWVLNLDFKFPNLLFFRFLNNSFKLNKISLLVNSFGGILYTVKKCYMINHVPKAHAINHTNFNVIFRQNAHKVAILHEIWTITFNLNFQSSKFTCDL